MAASATSAQSPTQGAAGPGGRGHREVRGVPCARGSPGRHARQSHSETRDPPQVAHGSSPAEAVDGSPGVTGKGPPLPGAVGTLTRVSRRGWSDGRTAGHEAHAAQSGGGAVGTGSRVGAVRATRPPVSPPCAGGSKLSGRADGVSVPARATDRACPGAGSGGRAGAPPSGPASSSRAASAAPRAAAVPADGAR